MLKLIVGGTFDQDGGKPSYLISQLSKTLGNDWTCVNGGHIEYIRSFSPKFLKVLLWMPNVSNDEVKKIEDLKTVNPHMILIQSKRVVEKEYSPGDVVGRLLKSHSLLGIMISKEHDLYRFRVLDPLGNLWADTADIVEVGLSIKSRIDYLTSLSRVGSIKKNIDVTYSVPDEFITVIKQFGDEFTKYVNAVNPNRLLGNASTRCAKGFPAMRMDDHILVTRRNVDKQTLCPNDFVLVENSLNKAVHYAGDSKPSVDTPIQVKLFEHFKNVNYIIHGHAYVTTGSFTTHKVPCGYLEEFDEIVSLVPDSAASNFCINLRGHGCLILASTIEYLSEQLQNLHSRPFPEE